MQNKDLPILIRLLLFFAFFIPAMNGFAQQVTTNSNGEKIVIFDDGSWRYFNPDTDAALEQRVEPEKVNTSGSLPDMVNSKKNKKGKVKKTKAAKVKKSKKEKVKKTKKGKKAKKGKKPKKVKSPKPGKKVKTKKNKKVKKNKKGKIKKQKKPRKPGKKPKKSKGKKIVKRELSPEEIRQSNALAVRRAERAAATAAKTQRIYEEAMLDRVLLEKKLQEAYSSLETTDTDIAEIESRLQLVRAKEVVAEGKYNEAKTLAKDYEKMIDMPYHKREKMLAKMEGASGADFANANGTSVSGGGENIEVSKAEQKKMDEVKSRRDEMNVMSNPPKPPCKLVFNKLDEFSGKVRKDVAKELFFTYTNERMRPYFKNREYITCNAGLASLSGDIYFLKLDLEVASEKAKKEYGFLEKGSALIVKMIDGSTVRLLNQKTDMGTLNPLQKSVVYKPQYIITGSQVKSLSKGEVDRVRVVWSTGYEDYEVYELDFFINQMSCLKGK